MDKGSKKEDINIINANSFKNKYLYNVDVVNSTKILILKKISSQVGIDRK